MSDVSFPWAESVFAAIERRERRNGRTETEKSESRSAAVKYQQNKKAVELERVSVPDEFLDPAPRMRRPAMGVFTLPRGSRKNRGRRTI